MQTQSCRGNCQRHSWLQKQLFTVPSLRDTFLRWFDLDSPGAGHLDLTSLHCSWTDVAAGQPAACGIRWWTGPCCHRCSPAGWWCPRTDAWNLIFLVKSSRRQGEINSDLPGPAQLQRTSRGAAPDCSRPGRTVGCQDIWPWHLTWICINRVRNPVPWFRDVIVTLLPVLQGHRVSFRELVCKITGALSIPCETGHDLPHRVFPSPANKEEKQSKWREEEGKGMRQAALQAKPLTSDTSGWARRRPPG